MEHNRDVLQTSDVVDQLEKEQLDLAIVRWSAGENSLSSEQKKRIDKLRQERGDAFYTDLIFALIGRHYPSSEAYKIWQEIIAHRNKLTQMLERNPGVIVAALDWLTNLQPDLEQKFSLIESGKLKTLLKLAVVDGLTGLYDHDTLCILLKKEIERAKRHSEKVSLLLLDLDDFKKINDTLGHQKGDDVLVQVADVIRENIRTMDIAGRYGGEEFVIILPEADLSAAAHSAERLREAIADRFSQDVKLTVSIGASCFADNAYTSDALFKSADEAMYEAKISGKNRVQVS